MELKSKFQQYDFGPLPVDWKAELLGELCTKIQDGNYGESYPKSHEFLAQGVPFLTSKAIGKDGELKENLIDFISEKKHTNLAKAHIAKSDVLFTNRGASVGAIGFVDERIQGGNIGPQLTLLRANTAKVMPKFLFQIMKSNFVRRQILGQDSGSAMNFFGIGSTKKFQIPLPPLPEQIAIAEALSDADALITSLEKLIEKKRAIKQGAMQELLTGKRRLPGFSGEWEVKKLGEIASLSRTNVIPAASPEQSFTHFSLPAFDSAKMPVIEQGKLILSNKFRVPKDAVLLSKLNPRIPRVWAPTLIPEDAIASTEFLVLVPKENVSRNFLYTICSADRFIEDMKGAATGTTGSHQRVNPSDALSLSVNISLDLDEQAAIAEVLADLNAEIQTLEQKLAKYRQIKQGMMQELLTGRIRLV